MGIVNEFKQALRAGEGSIKAGADAFNNFSWKSSNTYQAPLKSPGLIERGFIGFFKTFVGKPLSWGLKVAEVPVTIMMKPLKWIAATPGKFFKAFPRFAPIATVVAAVIGVGSWMTSRKSEAMQQTYENQAMAAQMMAAQAPDQPPVSYMNSVSQTLVDARIAQDKAAAAVDKATSHAATVEAERKEAAASEGLHA